MWLDHWATRPLRISGSAWPGRTERRCWLRKVNVTLLNVYIISGNRVPCCYRQISVLCAVRRWLSENRSLGTSIINYHKTFARCRIESLIVRYRRAQDVVYPKIFQNLTLHRWIYRDIAPSHTRTHEIATCSEGRPSFIIVTTKTLPAFKEFDAFSYAPEMFDITVEANDKRATYRQTAFIRHILWLANLRKM